MATVNFEDVKDKIVYKIVNTERNEELLRMVPSVPYLDLSLIFYYKVGDDYEFTPITNEMMENWMVTADDLYDLAQENTINILGLIVKGIIDEIIFNLQDVPFITLPTDSNNVPLYVLSNINRTFGSGYITRTDVFKEMAKKFDRDLYIIPCSVHELLIAPVINDTDIEREQLKEMIQQVNDTEIRCDEILSYNLYRFNEKTGMKEIA